MNIVTVNVYQTVAPTPSELQRTGALVSTGGTTLPPGTLALLTTFSDLIPLLNGPSPIQSITWAAGVATVTTAVAHNIPATDMPLVAVSGVVPAGFNTPQANVTVTGADSFSYPVAIDPGPVTVQGSWVLSSYYEIQQMARTYFDQGLQHTVYVLELGVCAPDQSLFVQLLDTYIQNNPQRPSVASSLYSYLLPRACGFDNTPMIAYIQGYDGLTAKTYFWLTTTLAAYPDLPVMKSCIALVEAPSVALNYAASFGEFTLAAAFQASLAYNPSSTNQVAPFAWKFLYGVTPYPEAHNGPVLQGLQNANVNYAGSAAEGGLSDVMLVAGTTLDGRDFTYWFSVDWVQINGDLEVTNVVIDGSNNSLAPLYYNQPGINRLQAAVQSLMKQAISAGLALGQLVTTRLPANVFAENLASGVYDGQVVVQAEPFVNYVSENPEDYPAGNYGGLAVAYTPARGFKHIVFNINVSDFAAA